MLTDRLPTFTPLPLLCRLAGVAMDVYELEGPLFFHGESTASYCFYRSGHYWCPVPNMSSDSRPHTPCNPTTLLCLSSADYTNYSARERMKNWDRRFASLVHMPQARRVASGQAQGRWQEAMV